ncbi:MAG TPA: chemotaxis protein CheW [Oligoflexus sp.]|uniref:chemotaxis protein CheW n=1 Tax=Oligoflexus sp. TaxID=1971216 RepID=UPI002D6554A9|nr:chemotaxis protein CheW [Oligoflexus sp.]HYX38844.1 chemotaxis protein CheW [Oligoflexus sp.]
MMDSRNNENRAQAGQYLTFTLQGQAYGIAIATVCEINRMTRISPVPQVPDFVSGVMNLRGKVVPVVDLGRRFGFVAAAQTKETCIIVTEGSSGQVGNIVDSVSGVVDLSAQQIQPPPPIKNQGQISFVIGMGQTENCVVILVNTAEVLCQSELLDMKDIHAAIAAAGQLGEVA